MDKFLELIPESFRSLLIESVLLLSFITVIFSVRSALREFKQNWTAVKESQGLKKIRPITNFLEPWLAVFVSFALLLASEFASRQLDAALKAQDPFNQPVAEVTATMRFTVQGEGRVYSPDDQSFDNALEMLETKDAAKPRTMYLGSFQVLYGEKFRRFISKSDNSTNTLCSMVFSADGLRLLPSTATSLQRRNH